MELVKRWYAKRFLHPDIVAPYDYIFIWDEDVGIEHFDGEEFVEIMAPVFSRDAWRCVWHMIQNDLKKKTPDEFEPLGCLWGSATRGVFRFRKKGKFSPRYIGPFEISERVGELAYRLTLPPSLSHVHSVFHVSQLRKYVPDPSHVIDFGEVEIGKDITFSERPVKILERRNKELRHKTIPLVKVQWLKHGVEEATWETEDDMRAKYPELSDS
ncbi:hypothetical protein OROGR_021163 [Orobanche gracilis]